MTEYQPCDKEAEELRENYRALVASIQRNIDPRSNTVLIVDDEKGIRKKVARDVRKFDPNIVIFEAANGKEALKQISVIRNNYVRDPLLIVLDLNMPIMDGWEVIEKLKEDYQGKGQISGIPIVVLSSTSGEKSRMILLKQSVHSGKSGYTPLVSVAKETCIDRSRYDTTEQKGLLAWLEFFVKK